MHRLVLLGLPDEIQGYIIQGVFDFSYGSALKKLDGMLEAQIALAKKIAKGHEKYSYGGISSVKEADEEVAKVLAQIKRKEELCEIRWLSEMWKQASYDQIQGVICGK